MLVIFSITHGKNQCILASIPDRSADRLLLGWLSLPGVGILGCAATSRGLVDLWLLSNLRFNTAFTTGVPCAIKQSISGNLILPSWNEPRWISFPPSYLYTQGFVEVVPHPEESYLSLNRECPWVLELSWEPELGWERELGDIPELGLAPELVLPIRPRDILPRRTPAPSRQAWFCASSHPAHEQFTSGSLILQNYIINKNN